MKPSAPSSRLGKYLLALCLLCSPALHAQDRYLELAAYWSPDLWQDTGWFPEGDYITAFDGDGDWIGNNNLESLQGGKFKPYPAYVYYSLVESETHFFILYDIYHPFDYDRPWLKHLPGAFHENDTESVMLVLAKEANEPYGRLRCLETTPHGYTRYYANDPQVRPRSWKPCARLYLRDGHHPQIYIQWGGHGPYALHARGAGLSTRHGFHRQTGVVYRYKGVAETPHGPNDRDVGYALIEHTSPRGLWANRCRREAFDDYQPYPSPPGRPSIPEDLLCEGLLPFNLDGDTSGDSTGVDNAGLFYGRDGSVADRIPRGTFGLDPAWAMARHWHFPEPYSLNYIYNPYLGIK